MKLLELRYRKLPVVDKIMGFVDAVALGDNPSALKVFTKYGIDPYDNPEQIRQEITTFDEFRVMQLHRALMGGK